MTTKTQTATVDESKLILELRIDTEGRVQRTISKTEKKDTLEGTLLAQVYPDIRVARVSVPAELTSYEQAVVENTMATLQYEGVEYRLIGASGAAKEGRFYFVDAAHAPAIAERFQHWPQAAIVYFSILVTDCKVVIEEPYTRILVVKDHVLGTNDCRGWIRESLYNKLNLAPDRFVQFRLAFDTREPKQAKGAFKAMSDGVADRLAVDVVLPESSVKPSLKAEARFLPGIGVRGNLFHGPIVLGTKSVSTVSEYKSSYTLLEHASEDSVESEILPLALEQIGNVRRAWTDGNYDGLFEVIGKFVAGSSQRIDQDTQESDYEEESESDAARSELEGEWEPVEAALMADGSGMVVHIPYVSGHMNRRLARWAWRTLTSGGFRLPSFALADDGILVEHQGKVLAASDWIPENAAITSLTAEKSLAVRYPIRMKEDLLPVRHLSDAEIVAALPKALGVSELPEALVDDIVRHQLRLDGTYSLHSETAAKNGGDFDFDTICVVPSDRFPKFVESRVAHGEQFHQVKTKHKKARSPWWNMQLVAMKARGNKIGSITDLKTSCIAAGRRDLAYQLVEQLQNALDSLKHKVEVDENVVSAIRKEVATVPWLKLKHERTVSELPLQVEAAAADVVGKLYNQLRPVLGDLLAETLPIQEFRGLFRGETVTPEMFKECSEVNAIYGSKAAIVKARGQRKLEEYRKAQAAWEAVRKSDNREQKKAAVVARNKAYAALKADEEQTKEDFAFLNRLLHRWAKGKQDLRRAWAQATATVVTNGDGSGGVLFNTFPQEFCDLLAENTGGRKVRVRMPRLPDGHILVEDGKMISVYPFRNEDGSTGEHRALIAGYTGKPELDFSNSVLHQ
ncbi:MAG TPA: hypothetical protein VK638_40355 [Edaphobacter sp.]|nr:hypothetical protein [Edaphobacter sp.]